MKVLIVGAGIGGLTLGAFLKEFDIDFDIIEKSTNWNRQGFTLGIWNNGRAILSKLGLADRFDLECERIKHFHIYNGQGTLLKKYDLNEFYVDYGTAYTHINRDKIHDWLLTKVGGENVRLGLTVDSVKNREGYVEVKLSNGETRNYDVVVGADGIHSQVRKLAFRKRDFEHYMEWRIWYAWINNKFKEKHSAIQFVEASEFISVFDDKDRTLCVMMTPMSHSLWDDEKGRIERIKNHFKHCSKLIPAIFEDLGDSDVTPTDICTVSMKRWHSGGVVLLGDAAHAIAPFAGLGASMAMEDAYVLAGELAKNESREQTLEEAFSNYFSKRKRRLMEARMITWDMSWWAIVKSKFLRTATNILGPHIPEKLFTRDFHKLLSEEI